MGDRVPIGPIPGTVGALVGTDVALGALGIAAQITRIFLARWGQPPAGTGAGSIRNAPAGGGQGIAYSFAPGADSTVAVGALDLGAADEIYLRVTSGAVAQDLRGWFELADPSGAELVLPDPVPGG